MARRWLVCALCLACGGRFATEVSTDAGRGVSDADAATCGSANDPRNCGACGHDCGGAACTRGLCVPLALSVTLRTPFRLALDSTYAYVTDQNPSGAPEGGRVLRLPKAGGAPVVLSGDEPGADAIALSAGSLYWARIGSFQANHADGSLRRLALGDGAPVTLQENAKLPNAIALDAVRAYWVESGVAPAFVKGGVRSMPLDGGAPTTLVTADAATSTGYLAIDDTYAYWTATNPPDGGFVARVPLAGGPVETIATTNQIPTYLVVDAQNVYWVEWSWSYDSGAVMAASHSGASPRKLWSGKPWIPTDLAVDGKALYWTESTNTGGPGRVMKLALSGGDAVTLAEEEAYTTGIAVDGTSVYWTTWSSSALDAPDTGAVKSVAK